MSSKETRARTSDIPQASSAVSGWMALAVLSAIGILAEDIHLELGVAGGVPYVISVLLASMARRASLVLATAGFCSILVVVGFYLSPPGGVPWIVISNRALAILAIWTIAALAAMLLFAQARERRSRALIRGVLDTVYDGVMAVDAHGAIKMCNPAAERIFGRTQSGLIGCRLEVLFPDDGDGRKQIRRYVEGGTPDLTAPPLELDGARANGESFPVELAAMRLETEGSDPLVVVTIRDLTDQKAAEAALAAQRERVEELRAKILKQEGLAALGGMAAGVSHEVSSPLSTALMAATHGQSVLRKIPGLEDGKGTGNPELDEAIAKQQEALQVVEENLRQAARIMRGFKQVAVDRVIRERRTIRLKDYLDHVLLTLGPRLNRTRHRVEINCPDDIELETDPGAVSQIVTNLVMNSLQHGFDGVEQGTIRIEVRPVDGGTELSYRDDGVGIPEEVQSQVFQAGFTTRRTQGGSGLGMSIVSNLVVRLLGGNIDVESSAGNGARFRIVIPDEPPAPEAEAAGTRGGAG